MIRKSPIRLPVQAAFLVICFAIPFAAQQARNAAELYQQAVAADESGEFEKAIALYRQLLALQAGSLQAHSNLGADLASTGHYKEAITEYQQALKIDPHNFLVRLNLALARYKQGDIEKAAQIFMSLHQEQGSNKQVLYLLADCYLRLGQNTSDRITRAGVSGGLR